MLIHTVVKCITRLQVALSESFDFDVSFCASSGLHLLHILHSCYAWGSSLVSGLLIMIVVQIDLCVLLPVMVSRTRHGYFRMSFFTSGLKYDVYSARVISQPFQKLQVRLLLMSHDALT